MEINIRKANVEDVKAIVFGNTAMAHETENKHLNQELITKGVKNILQDSSKGLYFVAINNQNKIVGQLMITYEWSDWRNGTFWWIQSVYILQKFRRQGIYRQLYAHINKLCQDSSKICGIRLYVDKNNDIARKTYLQLGMEMTHYDFMEKDFS